MCRCKTEDNFVRLNILLGILAFSIVVVGCGGGSGSGTGMPPASDPVDTVPDAFALFDQNDVELNTLVASNEITVSGVNTDTTITISSGEYSIDGGTYTSGVGTVHAGNSVKVRITSASTFDTETSAELNIGGVTESFIVHTKIETVDTNPPRIISTTPESLATNVDTEISIRVVFNEAMSPSSISSDAVDLRCGVGINGKATYLASENTMIFTPDRKLPFLKECNMSIHTTVTDVAGNPLAGVTYWSFTVRDGQWDTNNIELLQRGTDLVGESVFFDNSQDFMPVWYDSAYLYTKRYNLISGWGGVNPITSGNNQYYDPVADFNHQGQGVLAWRTATPHANGQTFDQIAVATYDTNTGAFGAETIVSDNPYNATSPDVAIDAEGNILVVWFQQDSTQVKLWAKRYSVTQGWLNTYRIDFDDADPAIDYVPKHAEVVMDVNGDGMIVWYEQYNLSNYQGMHIWARQFQKNPVLNVVIRNGGWDAARLVQTYSESEVSWPAMVVSGDKISIAWVQHEGVSDNYVYIRSFAPASGWYELVYYRSTDLVWIERPSIATNTKGEIVVAFKVQTGNRSFALYAAVYDALSDVWGGEHIIGELANTIFRGSVIMSREQVILDDTGNAICAWHEEMSDPASDAQYSIRYNRFIKGLGWESAKYIFQSTDIAFLNYATRPQLAISQDGYAMLVWNAAGSIRAVLFK